MIKKSETDIREDIRKREIRINDIEQEIKCLEHKIEIDSENKNYYDADIVKFKYERFKLQIEIEYAKTLID